MRLPPLTPWALLERLREEPDNARKLANGWILVGFGVPLFGAAFALAHFFFDVPVTNTNAGRPATDSEILLTVGLFWLVGFAFATMGILLKRWIDQN